MRKAAEVDDDAHRHLLAPESSADAIVRLRLDDRPNRPRTTRRQTGPGTDCAIARLAASSSRLRSSSACSWRLLAHVAPTLGRPLLENHPFARPRRRTRRGSPRARDRPSAPRVCRCSASPSRCPSSSPLSGGGSSRWMSARGRPGHASDRPPCFLATALLLFGLVRHVAGPISAWPRSEAFVLTPFSLVWARASMIEYLATAGGVGFTWATIAWREKRRRCLRARARRRPGRDAGEADDGDLLGRPGPGLSAEQKDRGRRKTPRTPGVDSDSRSVADRSSAPLDAACRRDQSGESDDRLA